MQHEKTNTAWMQLGPHNMYVYVQAEFNEGQKSQ